MNKYGLVEWLKKIENPKTRPSYITKIYGDFNRPSGCDSYFYRYVNLDIGINKHPDRRYAGVRTSSPERYDTSSKSDDFLKDKASCKFSFEVVAWGSYQEMLYLENQELERENAKYNPLYYNEWNGQKGTKPRNLELQNIFTSDINNLRKLESGTIEILKSSSKMYKGCKILSLNNIENKKSFLDLYNERSRVQVRSIQLINKNIEKIKDRIKYMGSTGRLLPVYLKNRWYGGVFYEYIQISGNHTVYCQVDLKEHYQYIKTNSIVIGPENHDDLTDTDIREIANNLNVQTEVGEPFNKDDGLKEAKDNLVAGNTWYSEKIEKRWRVNGLITRDITWIKRQIDDLILDNKNIKNGKTKVNYSTPEGQAIIEEKRKSVEKPNRLILVMAGTTPNKWKLHNELANANQKILDEKRLLGEKTKTEDLYDEVFVFLYHNSDSLETQSENLVNNIEHIKNLPSGTELKEHMDSIITEPVIVFKNLPRYMDDSIYKKYKDKIENKKKQIENKKKQIENKRTLEVWA